MSEVMLVLKRSPLDPENGVWIDGNKISDVKDVAVYGASTEVPQVVITLLPKRIVMGISDPDIDKVPNDPKN